MAGADNLKPLTTEKAREIGKKGGIASGKAKREKKLVSQIYAEFLAKKHKTGQGDISGEDMLEKVVMKVLSRGDSASVALMKEIREATEGSKIDLSAMIEAPINIVIEGVDPESSGSEKADSDIPKQA